MRKNLTFISFIIIFGTLISGTSSADEIKAVSVVYPPYMFDGTNGGDWGSAIEITQEIFKKAGHTMTVQICPWKRAVNYIQAGNRDAIFIYGITDDDPVGPNGPVVFPEEPIAMLTISFAVLKNSTWTYNGIDSLKKIKLGTILGYSWEDPELMKYMNNTPDPAVQALSGGTGVTERSLRKLLKGRMDAYIDSTDTMMYEAKRIKVNDQIKFVSQLPQKSAQYVCFSPINKKSRSYAQIFDEGIRAMRKSGALQDILTKYGIKDWVE